MFAEAGTDIWTLIAAALVVALPAIAAFIQSLLNGRAHRKAMERIEEAKALAIVTQRKIDDAADLALREVEDAKALAIVTQRKVDDAAKVLADIAKARAEGRAER